jgi:hypothetical protein
MSQAWRKKRSSREGRLLGSLNYFAVVYFAALNFAVLNFAVVNYFVANGFTQPATGARCSSRSW